jgi:alkaline phosphatase
MRGIRTWATAATALLIGSAVSGCQPSARTDSRPVASTQPTTTQARDAQLTSPRDAQPPGAHDAMADTPAPGAPPAQIAAAGDVACDVCAQAATAGVIDALLAGQGLAGALVLGDEAYPSGLPSDFQSFYAPAWGRPEILAISHPVPGNHEYETGAATGYFDFFDGPGAQTGIAGPRDQGYYSFDLAGWHFIALNTSDACRFVSCAAGSPQQQWLVADLAAHPTRCTLAFWHHPRFQAGSTSGELTDAAPLWNALYDAGADVVLNGHEHGYQQLSPLDKDGQIDLARGIRTFVVGTGGGEYDTTFAGPRVGALETTLTGTHGVLQLTLYPDRYDWQFVGTDGTRPQAASGSASCH